MTRRSVGTFVMAVLVFALLVAPVSAAKPKVTIYHFASNVVKPFIDEFNASQSNVEAEFQQPTKYWDYLYVTCASGTLPDTFYTMSGPFPTFVYNNCLLDLTPYVERDPEFKELKKIIPKQFWDMATFDGKLYGIPHNWNTKVIHYNRDLFDQSGVTYPTASWTWNDFLTKAQKLTSLRPDGTTAVYGYVAEENTNNRIFDIEPWLFTNAASVFDAKLKSYAMDSPNAIEAMQFLADLDLKYHVTKIGLNPSQTFGDKQAAMTMTTVGGWPTLDNWDIQVPPQNKSQLTPLEGGWMSVAKNTKNPEAAVEVVKAMASEMYQNYLAGVGWGTVIPTMFSSPKWAAGSSKPKNPMVFANSVTIAKQVECPLGYDKVQAVLKAKMSDLWKGISPARTVLEAMKPEVNAILDTAWGAVGK